MSHLSQDLVLSPTFFKIVYVPANLSPFQRLGTTTEEYQKIGTAMSERVPKRWSYTCVMPTDVCPHLCVLGFYILHHFILLRRFISYWVDLVLYGQCLSWFCIFAVQLRYPASRRHGNIVVCRNPREFLITNEDLERQATSPVSTFFPCVFQVGYVFKM